jgi:hypothetical protein
MSVATTTARIPSPSRFWRRFSATAFPISLALLIGFLIFLCTPDLRAELGRIALAWWRYDLWTGNYGRFAGHQPLGLVRNVPCLAWFRFL